jgi:hypothetical protein
MISTNVKPALLDFLMFILTFLPFCHCGVNEATGGLYNYGFCSHIACRNRKGELSRRNAKIGLNLYFAGGSKQKRLGTDPSLLNSTRSAQDQLAVSWGSL